MSKKLVISIIIFLTVTTIRAQDEENVLTWPREIDTEKGNVTLYQPQLESYESNILEGRMAVSIMLPEGDLIFGAVWFKASLSTDFDKRTVVLESMEVPRVNFPDLEDKGKVEKFTTLLIKEVESWNTEMSLDRLLAGMSEIENQKNLSVQLNNEPPDIYFRTSPAVLISIDGEPKLKTDEDSKLEYVQNTPFFIVKEPKKDNYYIRNGKFWYVSEEVVKGWTETEKIPNKIEKFAEKYNDEDEPDSLALSITEAPDLIVVTKPSELISTDGKPDYATIEGTSLLYASNSEDDIVMDINTQQHYVLIAGRWNHSKTLDDGDWKFVEPEDLPEDFAKIPETSDMSSVRASVPGTPEAQDALLEQSIPQTATIDRKEAKLEVKYDGNPKFEKIEGTDMSYAVNTDKTVILISNKYYCVDDAVWFVSDKASGPWEVSVIRPDEVDEISPESPVYNVKYVYIYDSTPEVVYVGYLPGYSYSYVYGGVVVYGTGYYYNPWYGPYYYPRPVTYGYGVHYNPYTGWGFSFSMSVRWGFHPYHGFGSRGYHYGYRRGYHHGYRHGYNRGYSQGAKAGYRAGQRNSASNNVYNNRNNGVKNTGNNRGGQTRNNTGSAQSRPSNKQNNMYTDKKGNVYQQGKNGNWDKKSNAMPSQQPTNKPANTQARPQNKQANTQAKPQNKPANTQPRSSQQQMQRSQQQQLNRSAQNRSRGTQNYNSSRSYSGGGASRSGGGGRRR
ncbi:MAG: hypothetical protein U9N53_02700 [Bacteroidota bacterium]|nr:hypothetical protein [Bacteroidota bacterium]